MSEADGVPLLRDMVLQRCHVTPSKYPGKFNESKVADIMARVAQDVDAKLLGWRGTSQEQANRGE